MNLHLLWTVIHRNYVYIFLLLLTLILLGIYVGPFLSLIYYGTTSSSIHDLMTFLTYDRTIKMFSNTFVLVTGGTAISILLGISLAVLFTFFRLPYRRLLMGLILLPLILPTYIIALAWISLFESNGLMMSVLRSLGIETLPFSLYSLGGMTILMGITHYPLVFFTVLGTAERLPRTLWDAARLSGATPYHTLIRIVLPLLRPAVLSGAALAFLASLDNFGIPAFLGIPAKTPVLSTYIYEQIAGFGPGAFARAALLSVLLVLFALFGLMTFHFFSRRETSMAFFERSGDFPRMSGPWARIVFFGMMIFYLCTSVLPLLSLALGALVRAYGLEPLPENLSLSHVLGIFDDARVRLAAVNSAILGGSAAWIVVIIGIAFILMRRKSQHAIHDHIRVKSALITFTGTIVQIPFALPGLVLSLGIILLWISPLLSWTGIYGTAVLIAIAYIIRYTALGLRTAEAGFARIDSLLEDAARVSGARFWSRFRRILLPEILPDVAAGLGLVFLLAGTDLTVSVLLASARNETLGVRLFQLEQGGALNQAQALALWMVLIYFLLFMLTFVLRFLTQRIRLRKERKNHP